MCNFLCQAVKIQILSFFFFQSLPLEPLCEPIHQTPKVDKTSTSEKFKDSWGHRNHQERKSLQLWRFFGFTNFLDCKVFAAKKFVAARYGGNKNGVAPLCVLNQFSFHFLDIFLFLATCFSFFDIFDQEFRQICFQYMKVHFMEGPTTELLLFAMSIENCSSELAT